MKPEDLKGKTIKDAYFLAPKGYDDTGYLKLVFTDNTDALIVASYGGYTGYSEDEYPTVIDIQTEAEYYEDNDEVNDVLQPLDEPREVKR